MGLNGGGLVPGGGGGSGSGGITEITSTGGTITVTDATGPTTNIEVALPTFSLAQLTSGNVALTDASLAEIAAGSGGPGSGSWDLTVPAAAGHVIVVSLNANLGSQNQNLVFDVATIVSGSVVNWLSNGTGTSASDGIAPWFTPGGTSYGIQGMPWFYEVQSGDLHSGQVRIRAFYTSAGARTFFSSTGDPAQFAVINYGNS